MLENIDLDCSDPRRLGRWWAEALGAEVTGVDDTLLEARLRGPGGMWLDLSFGAVPEPPREQPVRLHLDLAGGTDQAAVVDRLFGLGATHADIGQGDVPWVVLADPEGNAFCVLEERPRLGDTGPIAALPLDVDDLTAATTWWRAATGWVLGEGYAPTTLRHPSGVGAALELCPQLGPKSGKNRMHLDVRAPEGQGERLVEELLDLGGSRVEHDWGPLGWTVLADPSGNEMCVLGVPS